MIIMINPNSTVSMTEEMLKVAQRAVPGAQIEAWTSHEGPPAIEGPEDGESCIPPLLALVEKALAAGATTIVIGCSDDTGLFAAREMAPCPVIGIGQAGYHMAALAGPRFSVVTTLDVSIPILAANVAAYGLDGQLGRVRASGVPVLDLETNRDAATAQVLAEISTAAREDNIQSIVLGCAGMSHIPAAAPRDIPVRLIDGVSAAARIAVALQ
ncbi:aspartate/glutamate racemase family protein [Marivita sp.]|uniref:aspartate/glutamate racemase family protein n=1 Tax=Marivita sp. TaxID=2003365 RepID=UPI003F6CAD4E